MKFTQSNMAVANFGVAVNRKWTDGAGEKKEETTFVDCEAWGKTAEAIGKFFAKGRPIFIEGRLKFDEWQDKTSGQKLLAAQGQRRGLPVHRRQARRRCRVRCEAHRQDRRGRPDG